MCKNYNSGNRSLLTTIAILVVCLVIVTGSTFSLFTSNTGVNIAVTAGKVDLTASILKDSLVLSSMGQDLESKTTFENGGTAGFNAEFTTLSLGKITPGDKATFQIQLKNESNVDVKYNLTWTVADDLAKHLVITVGNDTLAVGETNSDWYEWNPSENPDEMLKTITVSVEFPTTLFAGETDEVRYAKYRDLMNMATDIKFSVFAVQANGADTSIKVTTPDELNAALDVAQPGDVIDAEGVTFEVTNNASLPAGITIKGATIANVGSQHVLSIGAADSELVLEDCSISTPDMAMFVIGVEAGGKGVVFNNCTFTGQISPNCTAEPNAVITFNNCSFTLANGAGSVGYVNCMGGRTEFYGCTFDYTGGATFGSNQYTKWSAVNAYSESRFSAYVLLEGCTFIGCTTYRVGPNSTLIVR